MKLKDARENYYYYSQKASDIVRQIGLAGIALIWVFKLDMNGRQVIPLELTSAAKFIVISLTLDLLHYVAGTLIWGIYNRWKERAGTHENTEFTAPPQINWATITLFWLKIVMMIVAYIIILVFLVNRVF